MKKVYCKNCELYELDDDRNSICNSKNREYIDTPTERIDVTSVWSKNCNNNCKEYKESELI